MKHTHGGDIYKYADCVDFSANCNPLGTPEGVLQAVRNSAEKICHYPQVGSGKLREAIAGYEGVSPDQVICGNGAAEVVFSLCQAVQPKKALLPAPAFAEYEQALQAVRCEIGFYLTHPENSFSLQEDFS
ncbi:MAG: aminotransferase class I/II-fold pyridoxal phosphate-dependent enzyme, partial [Blautia sp.]|nr:aminotransferase class I/II-fold pyridoxal phosphate-dependent enzyme [Blautia sp.]